jgi:hypothetical protein
MPERGFELAMRPCIARRSPDGGAAFVCAQGFVSLSGKRSIFRVLGKTLFFQRPALPCTTLERYFAV